jgi:1-acyl-sn-glycerol-3-phosphate acyltransferase
VSGKENIPADGAGILASNHLSFLDHFILPLATARQIYFISKVQHFESPVQRFLFKRWGVIPLKRGESDQSAFTEAIETIDAGHLFGIYPEGTRSPDGRLHKGHTGVARLAVQTAAPVLPVAMIGTREAQPIGQGIPRFFMPITIRIGRPLTFARHREREGERPVLREVTDEIMFELRELSGQEYVDRYAARKGSPEAPVVAEEVKIRAAQPAVLSA